MAVSNADILKKIISLETRVLIHDFLFARFLKNETVTPAELSKHAKEVYEEMKKQYPELDLKFQDPEISLH